MTLDVIATMLTGVGVLVVGRLEIAAAARRRPGRPGSARPLAAVLSDPARPVFYAIRSGSSRH